MADPQVASRAVTRLRADGAESGDDLLAVEAALEIRVDGRPLVVTLRTPGHDRELAIGFLGGEGILSRGDQVRAVQEQTAACSDEPDAIDLQLAPDVRLDWSKLERHFASTSACGICGRAHLESLRSGLEPIKVAATVAAADLAALPGRMREHQTSFRATGGLHAAAFVDHAFDLQVLREDIGRHNAVDKVVGWLLEAGRLPADGGVLWVSGRAGAEIVLKAARARMPVLAAVGAPSTLAIDLAAAAGMTLIGFLREGRMTVYSGPGRVQA